MTAAAIAVAACDRIHQTINFRRLFEPLVFRVFEGSQGKSLLSHNLWHKWGGKHLLTDLDFVRPSESSLTAVPDRSPSQYNIERAAACAGIATVEREPTSQRSPRSAPLFADLVSPRFEKMKRSFVSARAVGLPGVNSLASIPFAGNPTLTLRMVCKRPPRTLWR